MQEKIIEQARRGDMTVPGQPIVETAMLPAYNPGNREVIARLAALERGLAALSAQVAALAALIATTTK
jgi:hypothetical protein